jgi:hypothetical protein
MSYNIFVVDNPINKEVSIMAKRLEIKKLFDQLNTSSSRMLAIVEPHRYVVTDGFIVEINNQIVNSLTIDRDRHVISGNNKQGKVVTDEFEYDFYDIVEYNLYKHL